MDRGCAALHWGGQVVAVRKLNSSLTPGQRMQMDRVQRAKKAEKRWDAAGTYHEKCAELARHVGMDPADLYEEFGERAAVRAYLGELPVERAEELAWTDVLSRFEVKA